MAAADRATNGAGTPSMDLMARAGAACGRAAVRMLGGTYGRRILIVCGKGNNGGDGLIMAEYLAGRGALCTIVLLAAPADLKGDALTAYRRAAKTPGCRLRPWTAAELRRSDLAVDAMLGTGFQGALSGPFRDVADAFNQSGKEVLAIDIPSGVDGETGAVEAVAVRAALTITLGALKSGLLLHPGSSYAGRVEVADIGILPEAMKSQLRLAGAQDVHGVLPERPPTAHKRSVGKVLVVAGSAGMAGAAVLAARAALRTGAGLVRVAVPESATGQVGPQVKEALTIGLPESDGKLNLEAVGPVIELAREMHALALGPGIGRGEEVGEFVRIVLETIENPVVLDADGLAAYQGSPEGLKSRPGPTVLTPHAGELGRLLDIEATEVDAGRIGSAREAAERSGCIVLLKGFRTVVAAPGGEAVLVDAGGPVLATGGTGDVLTGVIAALLAGNVEPFTAAWAGACLHGAAGEELARTIGDRGVLAGDVADRLPVTMAGLTR
jgi:NAD(P)H-hydrate epimerase